MFGFNFLIEKVLKVVCGPKLNKAGQGLQKPKNLKKREILSKLGGLTSSFHLVQHETSYQQYLLAVSSQLCIIYPCEARLPLSITGFYISHQLVAPKTTPTLHQTTPSCGFQLQRAVFDKN